ncbi:MAG: type II toxin-antitoxin system HicA family toxin [Holosporaceae bacterium]|jgi:predicted RNA binding protein YcfA (HicA-like mRNA interferase family)|nr:type II toxin-antitoxin system HicA family toxin [Rhodospirillaceae bacterium]
MQRDQADVERGLLAKGFVKTDSHHHYFIYHNTNGKKTRITTKTSHGNREIGAHLIAQMAKQCGLSKAEFLSLVDCPLKQGDYENLLIERGKISALA